MRMIVGNLRKALEGLGEDVPVVFQGNVESEDDDEVGGEPGYTTCLGYVYDAFLRTTEVGVELVIDGAVTDSEL